MKVKGDVNPGTLRVEPQPDKPGYVLARFFENAAQYTEDEMTGWTYDEYQLELPDRPGLADEIEAYPAPYLAAAKAQEPQDDSALAGRVDELEQAKADKTEVQAVWDEMAAAYNEGVQQA